MNQDYSVTQPSMATGRCLDESSVFRLTLTLWDLLQKPATPGEHRQCTGGSPSCIAVRNPGLTGYGKGVAPHFTCFNWLCCFVRCVTLCAPAFDCVS